MKLPHISPVIGLAAITGCGQLPEGAIPLEGERYEHVEMLVDIAQESTPVVKSIVESMNGGWVDAQGSVDNPDPMLDAIDAAQETLNYYWKNNKIYVGPTAAMQNDENTVGVHSPKDFTPTDRSDNYIILNVDKEVEWGTELLTHESAHYFSHHDASIENDLLALKDVSYTNPDLARIVREHTDFAYMQSGLYVGSSSLLIALHDYREERLMEARTLLDAGAAKDAIQTLQDSFDMGDKDAWLMDQAEWITSWSSFYREFGITTEMLAETLAEGEVYEREQRRREAVLSELAQEITERRQEAMQEHRSRTHHITVK